MAFVTTDLLTDLLTTNQALFRTDFAAADAEQGWQNLASQMNSNGRFERYNWLGQVPTMQDVTNGEVEFGVIRPYNFTIENLLYKGGFEIERMGLEDDTELSMLPARISDLAKEAAAFPGRQIFQLFEDTTRLAYDGASFFSAHAAEGDSGVIDNDITSNVGTATAVGVTVAELQQAIQDVRAAMRGFKDDHGRLINHTPDTWVVAPALEQKFYQALNANAQMGALGSVIPVSASGMVSVGTYNMIVNPHLTSDVTFYGLNTRGTVRPFIYQTRMAPALESITDPNTDAGIVRERFPYTARSRHNVGFGSFRDAVKCLLN